MCVQSGSSALGDCCLVQVIAGRGKLVSLWPACLYPVRGQIPKNRAFYVSHPSEWDNYGYNSNLDRMR